MTASASDDRRGSRSDVDAGQSLSDYLTATGQLVAKLNEWEGQYGDLLTELAAAHKSGNSDRAERVAAAMRHLSFLFEATHSRLDVLNAVQTSTWSTILSDAAAAQGRQLARATWVLAAATIGLVVATVVLILVTAQA